MSNVSNRHNVNPFVAGKSQPLTGQRLARVLYKPSKKTPQKYPSVCVSVPQVKAAEVVQDYSVWLPVIQDAIEGAQDGIIRSLYESSKGKLSSVSDDELSYSAVLAFIESERSGGRLTKEFLENWFDSTINDNLVIAFCEKAGIDNPDDARIISAVRARKDMITTLSNKTVFFSSEQCEQLKKVLSLASEEDDTWKKLMQKIDAISAAPKIEDALEL